MANLRDRLRRIKDLNKNKPTATELEKETAELSLSGNWEKCGFKVLKRKVISELKYDFSHIYYQIPILISDMLGRVHTTEKDTNTSEPDKSSKHEIKFVVSGSNTSICF